MQFADGAETTGLHQFHAGAQIVVRGPLITHLGFDVVPLVEVDEVV